MEVMKYLNEAVFVNNDQNVLHTTMMLFLRLRWSWKMKLHWF